MEDNIIIKVTDPHDNHNHVANIVLDHQVGACITTPNNENLPMLNLGIKKNGFQQRVMNCKTADQLLSLIKECAPSNFDYTIINPGQPTPEQELLIELYNTIGVPEANGLDVNPIDALQVTSNIAAKIHQNFPAIVALAANQTISEPPAYWVIFGRAHSEDESSSRVFDTPMTYEQAVDAFTEEFRPDNDTLKYLREAEQDPDWNGVYIDAAYSSQTPIS